MPKTFIVKFIPTDRTGCVIHKIKMPWFGEPHAKGHSYTREVSKWNGFAHGDRKGKISKEDRDTHKTRCCWSPLGLYYCHDWEEDRWIEKCEHAREFQIEIGRPENCDKVDERLFPTVEHESIDDFFTHIGFDRKTRTYPDV